MAGGLITYAEVKALNEEAAAQELVEEEVTVLDNVTVRKTSTNWGSKYGSLNVEQGNKKLEVTMSGTGAAELYVRKGRNPTVYSFACKSVAPGTSSQSCTADVAFEGGTYFVRARSKTPNTVVSIVAKKLK